MPASLGVQQLVRHAVTLGGANVPNAFASRITAGATRRYLEAVVYCVGDPIGIDLSGALDREVTVWCGASGNGGANNRTRFVGTFIQPTRTLWPGVTQLICKGRLYKAAIARNPYLLALDPITNQVGMFGIDLSTIGSGAPPALPGVPDEEMVRYLLTAGEVDYEGGHIGGTGRRFGTIAGGLTDANGAPSGPFVWAGRDTVLSMIEAIDEVSIHESETMAYRTLESLGGIIYRVAMGGMPRGAFDVPEFVEGVDILRAEAPEGGLTELGNYAVVTGYADSGLPAVITIVQSANTFQDSSHAYGSGELNSPMIEFLDEATAAGRGMSTERGANYVLAQVNRLTKHMTMTTPRDDYVGPGQTHGVVSPTTGLTEPVWVQDVTIETNMQDGSFLQTFTYQGGGTEGGVLPPQ